MTVFIYDKERAIEHVRNHGSLSNCSFLLRNNKEVVTEAVKANGLNLHFAGIRFRHNKKIGLIALQSFGSVYSILSKKLQKNSEIICAALNSDGKMLGEMDKKYASDKKFVLLAVKKQRTRFAICKQRIAK